jgi:competence protein ComGC
MINFKLIKRQECVRLTWLGRLIVLLIISVVFIIVVKNLPYFLSPNKPVYGQIMVIDGQMPDYAIEKAIEIFKNGHYQLIATTGSNIEEGYHVSKFKTMADLSRGTFISLGFDSTKVIAIPTKFVKRNRTFNSAGTFKEWQMSNMPEIESIDVLTVGCHARRSWHLFKSINKPNIEVGIISVKHKSYDINHWWESSIGGRIVISETISYLFVLLNIK